MTELRARHVFSHVSLARLSYDEPVQARDAETGIDLHYRFEHAIGGRLRLTGGPLADRLICVGCDPDDINLVATLLLDGLKAQMP